MIKKKKESSEQITKKIERCITEVNLTLEKTSKFREIADLSKRHLVSKGETRIELTKQIKELKEVNRLLKEKAVSEASEKHNVSIIKIKQILQIEDEKESEYESFV